MSTQLHKNFTDGQVKSLLKSYLDKEIKINYILQMLKIKRRRFFKLLAKYRKNPDNFSIQYARKTINRKIDPDIERNIVKELKVEKDLIKNKEVPVKYYNYSYIKDLLEQKYSQRVSLPTIIDRAKRNNFYFLRPKRKTHDKEVLTNYPGELIQHDSSHHRFAPYAAGKWYLISPYPIVADYLSYLKLLLPIHLENQYLTFQDHTMLSRELNKTFQIPLNFLTYNSILFQYDFFYW